MPAENILIRLTALLAVPFVLAVLPATALAGPEDPSYGVSGGTQTDNGYRVLVMNDDGWGLYVYGGSKRKARKAAEKVAAELNEVDADTSECVDICEQFPEECFSL